jgi:hypothetical protein
VLVRIEEAVRVDLVQSLLGQDLAQLALDERDALLELRLLVLARGTQGSRTSFSCARATSACCSRATRLR